MEDNHQLRLRGVLSLGMHVCFTFPGVPVIDHYPYCIIPAVWPLSRLPASTG